MLPWIPSVKPSYTVYATADGATGQYRWVSNNTLVATVSYKQERSSRVTIVTRGEGEALISCQDIHNSVFSANLRTSIRPMVDIETLPAVLETHIGGSVILPIAVYGYESDSSKNKQLFDDCSQIPFEVEIIEKVINFSVLFHFLFMSNLFNNRLAFVMMPTTLWQDSERSLVVV